MLEGKEFSQKFDGDAGEAFLDVDAQGKVVVGLSYKKEIDLDGYAVVKANNENSLETDIFKIAEKIAAKTETKVDDMFIAGLKNLLGIK